MSTPPSPTQINGANSEQPKKRRKGATRLSCCECRRLKLRCDRQVPCSSCTKRGTSAICPDGSLTTGQGNRFVLASTQELHEKIHELSHRVRELEDGLRSSHTQLSRDPHPLLSEERLKIKMPLQREIPALRNGVATTAKEESDGPEVFDAFGSLSIDISGKSKYFGHAANSWYFLQNETIEDEELEDPAGRLAQILPPDILTRASSIPASASQTTQDGLRLQDLMWYLPPGERASDLKDIFYRQAAWMYDCITRETFDVEVFCRFYDPSWDSPNPTDSSTAHCLSILFMILSIGSLMDTTQPAYNVDAEKYHQLAKAALFQTCFIEEPTLHAVQALYLMTFYMFLSDRHGARTNARWSIMGIAIKIAQAIGLHKDSARWKLTDPNEVQRRRETFWELMTYDTLQCMTFSRPPSFSLAHIDTKMPFIDDSSDHYAYANWKHRFTVDCMTALHDQAFSAHTPSHSTVIQLDRRLRAFPVPTILQVAGFGGTESAMNQRDPVGLILQRHIVLSLRETNLLYLHRSFFARAITDHPSDPLGSPYGASVIAAYRSAGSLIVLLRSLHGQLKELSERMWFLWSHIFSCAIILGSIVTRCPSMSFASPALVQLDSACQLFAEAARGFRAGKVMSIMLHLQTKAHRTMDEHNRSKNLPPNVRDGDTSPAEVEELSALGGQTRLVTKHEPQSPNIPLDRSPNSRNPIVPLPLSPTATHPSIQEYLNSFVSTQQTPMDMGIHGQSSVNGYTPASAGTDDMSPVDMYNGMSQTSAAYHAHRQRMPAPQTPLDQPSFNMSPHSPIHQSADLSPTTPHSAVSYQGHHPLPQMQQMQQSHSFPAYFPVYDYGVPGSGAAMEQSQSFGNVPMLATNPHPHGQGHAHRQPQRNSPEAMTMHSTWEDFVNRAI